MEGKEFEFAIKEVYLRGEPARAGKAKGRMVRPALVPT
jgi:hypothetical protein